MNFSKFLTGALLAGITGLSPVAAIAGQGTEQGAAVAPWQTNLKLLDPRGGDKDNAPGYRSDYQTGNAIVLPPEGLVSQRGQISNQGGKPLQLAQSNDAAFRINQLEEEMRALNGKVEDMTFQLLQLQEQIRKMQEDNEFRFQELEKRGDAGSAASADENKVAQSGDESLGKSKPSDQTGESGGSDGDLNDTLTAEILDGKEAVQPEKKLGEPPISLGTLTFDGDGKLVDSNVGKPIDLTGKQPDVVDLPQDPQQLFDLGYQYVQAGEYQQAEEVYQRYVADYPGAEKESEAKFWLGESLFSQGKYEEAAKIFLENHKQSPDSPLGAQNLLKLGVSLAGLDQRELACATYAEVPKKYPKLSNSVRKRVEVEQRAAKCKNS